MGKSGATLGGAVGLIISLLLFSMPSGEEVFDSMPEVRTNISTTDDLSTYVQNWIIWLVVAVISISICGTIGFFVEEIIPR